MLYYAVCEINTDVVTMSYVVNCHTNSSILLALLTLKKHDKSECMFTLIDSFYHVSLRFSELYYVLRKVLRELWKDKRIVIEPAVLVRRMNTLNFLYDAIASQNLQETLSCLLEV